MSEKGVFRTCAFGGFNKKDVLNFFEQLKSEASEESVEIQKENERLKAELEEKTQKVEELLSKIDAYSDKARVLEEKVNELTRDNEKNENLENALYEAFALSTRFLTVLR